MQRSLNAQVNEVTSADTISLHVRAHVHLCVCSRCTNVVKLIRYALYIGTVDLKMHRMCAMLHTMCAIYTHVIVSCPVCAVLR